MALTKRVYEDLNTTIPITADNLNAIQDMIIWNTSYVLCGTAAATVDKTVTLNDFVLVAGATIKVRFTYTNTAANPTLNVSNTGAKAIKRYGSIAVGSDGGASWPAGAIVQLTYDGTNWVMLGSNTPLSYEVVSTF